MIIRNRLLAGMILAAAPVLAAAQVTVSEPWVRATVPEQQGTGAFMRIESAKDTRLVAARSPRAPVVEVHEMALENDVMRMREVPAISIAAGKPVELKPGGYHIMLMKLPEQVNAGDSLPLTLDFEDRDGRKHSVEVTATARELTEAATPARKGHGHGN